MSLDTTEQQQQATTIIEEQLKKQAELEEINKRFFEREKQRQREEEKKKAKQDQEKPRFLILGVKHLASHILYDCRNVAKMTVVDQVDPELIFKNPLIEHEGPPKSEVKRFQFARSDMERSLEKLLRGERFDFIINTICTHDPIYSATNPISTYETNVMFTQAMMNAIINSNTSARLLHISTDKVYGDTGVPSGVGDDGKMDEGAFADKYRSQFKQAETDTPNPKGTRAITRYLQEVIIKQTCETYGFPYMIFRVGNMYGRHSDRSNIWNQMTVDAFNTHTLNVYGDKYASRDFVNIEEVAKFIKRVLVTEFDASNSQWNEVYNIGGCGKTRQFIDGIAMFMQTMVAGSGVRGLDPQLEHYFLPYGSVRIKYQPPRCYEDTEEAAIRLWMDCTKAQEKLKYDPTLGLEWDIQIKETFTWVMAYIMGWSLEKIQEMKMKMQG